MKKKTLFLGILIFAIILPIFTFAATSNSEEFESLTMDIVIDDDGTASITEVWDITVYSGTEIYKAYSNMDTSVVQNLTVTEDGTKFTTLSSWDVDASDKTNKCGINTTSNGYEVCWGIGDYGKHTYTISYEITNFVSYYEDDEMQETYFTLVDSGIDPLPQSVEITVSASFDFTEDNISAKGYGFTGTTEIEDGKVVMKTTSALSSSDYMDLLIEYQESPFNTTDTVSSDSSSEVYPEDEGTTYSYSGTTSGSVSTDSSSSSSSSSKSKIGWYILIIVAIAIVVIFIMKGRKQQAEYYNSSDDDDNNNNPIQ